MFKYVSFPSESQEVGWALGDNFELAITAARKRMVAIEPRCIHARADREVRENFAVVSTHHDELLLIANKTGTYTQQRQSW